jgi:hypothetical protein
MSQADFPIDKFPDETLRQTAIDAGPDHISVLIEPTIAPPQARVDMVERKGSKRPGIVGIQPESPEQRRETERVTSKARAFLTAVLDEPPRWNSVARVFVAEPRGDQLQIIARSELVKAIRVNRRLK